LRDHDGVVKDTPTDMERMTHDYFQSVYTHDPTLDPSPVVSMFAEIITDDVNKDLCKPFSQI
jgi:hypothetical protein